MATDSDPGQLSDYALERELEQLEAEERSVSRRRQKLHELITYRKTLGNADGSPSSPEQIGELEAQEREVSERRAQIHRRLEELREERSRRGSRT